MALSCRKIRDDADMEAARWVRRRVFIEEQGVPEAEEWDGLDELATHFLLHENETIVGTARLVPQENGWCRIGRVAVVPEARGRGGATLLMREIIDHARRCGARVLVLDAQLYVIPFYTRLGFTAEGEPFMDAGIPHRRMTRKVDEP
jgi:predicted GNAT family N-acyltransferase